MGDLATRDHFGNLILELGETEKRFLVLNCDLGTATRTTDFKKRFPERHIECGISEANAISLAAGLSQEGFIPLACSFGHFLTGKFLEIFQSIGLNNSPVVLVGTHAGLAIGKDGPTQMGLRDLALMRLLPNLKVLHPVDGRETRAALQFAFQNPGPVYLRLCRQGTPELLPADYQFELGKPVSLLQGSDLLLVTQGGTVQPALQAAKALQGEGFQVGVVNISSLPLQNAALLAMISRYDKVLVVEDHFYKGGIADEVAYLFAKEAVHKPFSHLAVTDYGQAGDPAALYQRYGLDTAGIRSACLQFLKS